MMELNALFSRECRTSSSEEFYCQTSVVGSKSTVTKGETLHLLTTFSDMLYHRSLWIWGAYFPLQLLIYLTSYTDLQYWISLSNSLGPDSGKY